VGLVTGGDISVVKKFKLALGCRQTRVLCRREVSSIWKVIQLLSVVT
jgi:hypothetical protein